MPKVSFYPEGSISDHLLSYSVIVASYNGKWIFCRHKARHTWEIPGGHREAGETCMEAAVRELNEETGAINAEVKPITVYGVENNDRETFGMLFRAEVDVLQPLTGMSEIAEISLCDNLPCELTYPQIQPHLFRYCLQKEKR